MVVLDVSIVNVALPSMQRDLHFSLSNAQWVVNAYVLTLAGFLLLGGRAADIVGGLLGGILTGWVSWRWVFFINVPFGIAAAITAAMYLGEMRNQEATVKLDIVGAVLVTGSLATLIYGVVNTTTKAGRRAPP